MSREQAPQIYSLFTCGLDPRDKLLVNSATKLSELRPRQYRLTEEVDKDEDLIYIVDDSPLGWKQWKRSCVVLENPNAPVLVLSRSDDPLVIDANYYNQFKRPLVITRLLNSLDELVLTVLHDSELAIADEVTERDIRSIQSHSSASVPELGKKVLVIDDSESVRKLMNVKLASSGIDADFAEDGTSGIALAKDGGYDLIFLDVMLPDIDGYEICRILKKDLKVSSKVLMLTSRASRLDRLRGSLSTADEYLTKPLSSEDLIRVLHQYL